jgi:hypothetical protein
MSSAIHMGSTAVMEIPTRKAVAEVKPVAAEAMPGATAEFSPFAWKMITLTLAGGAVWLAVNAVWVLGGVVRYQDFSRLFTGY